MRFKPSTLPRLITESWERYPLGSTLLAITERVMTMNKLIAVLALTVAMINPAIAASPEFCAQASETAEVIMRNRQTGVSVIDMMKIANSSESTKKMLTGLINEAFAEPAYSTPEYQRKAIREFGSQQYLMCLAAE